MIFLVEVVLQLVRDYGTKNKRIYDELNNLLLFRLNRTPIISTVTSIKLNTN